MPPQKGKPATKGQKQIVEDNKATLKFYGIMALSAEILYLFSMVAIYYESYTVLYMFLTLGTIAIYGGCLQFMNYMARPVYSETGQLLDGGIDLNMESGIAEHLKDLIILTSAVQILAIFSNYFWLFLLMAPARGFYVLWVNFLGPWIFQPAPDVDEKKQKKMERKMRRH